MSRFKVSTPLPSPSENLTYAFSCLEGKQGAYMSTYRNCEIAFTILLDDCEIGGTQMTLVHFYADPRF